MINQELRQLIAAAEAAASHAQDVRATYRKRAGRGNKQRQSDIQHALNRLKRAMTPIRSELAKIPYELRLDKHSPLAVVLEDQRKQLLDASQVLQRERRKLWKMQERKGSHGKRRTRR